MAKLSTKKTGLALTTGRIQALADGIFAIAMTLLVLNLILPDATAGLPNVKLHALLIEQAHKFYNYFLSFMLLAIFWIVHHHQFHFIKRADSRLLWINMFILMAVALMPFSSDIIGDFSGTITAEVFFAGNLLILGLLFLANWAYATSNHRLVDPDLDKEAIIRGLRRSMVTPAVSVVVIALAFVIPSWCTLLYLIIPVLLAFRPFRRD
ncbi:MAG: DUF1211 domain-containing protein [Chloroflexi bacterium]|nr:DUF1211 domain-containing protein [Chloroflexota bacterium]